MSDRKRFFASRGCCTCTVENVRVGKLLHHSWAGGGIPKYFIISQLELPRGCCIPLQTSQVAVKSLSVPIHIICCDNVFYKSFNCIFKCNGNHHCIDMHVFSESIKVRNMLSSLRDYFTGDHRGLIMSFITRCNDNHLKLKRAKLMSFWWMTMLQIGLLPQRSSKSFKCLKHMFNPGAQKIKTITEVS